MCASFLISSSRLTFSFSIVNRAIVVTAGVKDASTGRCTCFSSAHLTRLLFFLFYINITTESSFHSSSRPPRHALASTFGDKSLSEYRTIHQIIIISNQLVATCDPAVVLFTTLES